MAMMAQHDVEQRIVQVNRNKLLETLKINRAKHVANYDDAMRGYKSELLKRIKEGFDDAEKKLKERRRKMIDVVTELSDDDISKQRDTVTLSEHIVVDMKVPRSHAKEYDAAIDIAKWDAREILDLSYAEFTCYVRDMWDWKSDFDAVAIRYSQKR